MDKTMIKRLNDFTNELWKDLENGDIFEAQEVIQKLANFVSELEKERK